MSTGLSGVHKRLRAQAWRSGILWGTALAGVGPSVFALTGLADLPMAARVVVSAVVSLGLLAAYAYHQGARIIQPFVTLRAGLVHLAPGSSDTTPPKPNEPRFAREATLEILDGVYSLYKYATQVAGATGQSASKLGQLNTLLDNLPVPLLVLTGELEVLHANTNALALLDSTMSKIEGRSVNTVLPLRQNNQALLQSWLEICHKSAVPDNVVWRGIAFSGPHQQRYWFDVYAHYSPGHATDPQIVLFLIDKTRENQTSTSPTQKRRTIDIVN